MAKAGRPKKVIDYVMVYKLARHFCTQAEIADILEISTVTLAKDKQFLSNYNLGKAKAKKSLRSAQYKYALKGNSQLLIWLGKQYLYQKEPDSGFGEGKQDWTQTQTIYGMNENAI